MARPAPRLAAVWLIFCTWAGAAHAQTAPPPVPPFNSGDALREAKPPPPAPASQPPAPPEIQEDGRTLSMPSGETLTVHRFVFEGAGLIADAELQAEVAPYRDRALTMAEIQQAAGKVTGLYRDRGYLLARAYVPRQDAADGTLRLRVVAGSFGVWTLKNESLVRDASIASVFAPLKNEAAVTRGGLERAMYLVADMPGAPLPKLTISPGEAPGTSDFDIGVGPGKRFGGYVLADDQGSRYTGQNRLSAGFDVNSPFGLADRFGINAVGTNGGGLLSGRVAYSVPIGGSGLRAQLAGSKTTYELGSDYADLDATGEARSIEAAVTYPLIRSRDRNLTISMSFAERHLRDDIEATATVNPKKADVATLSLQHDAWSSVAGQAVFTSVGAGISYGRLSFLDSTQAALNKAGADTAGHYARLNLNLLADVDLSHGWSLNTTASAQKALGNKNLDPSEQMSISGSNGVKAYRESASGDNGYLLTAHLDYVIAAWGNAVQTIGPFAELGRAYLQDGSYSTNGGVRLSDIGLSYKLQFKGLIAGLQLAHPIGPEQAGGAYDGATRLLVQIGAQY